MTLRRRRQERAALWGLGGGPKKGTQLSMLPFYFQYVTQRFQPPTRHCAQNRTAIFSVNVHGWSGVGPPEYTRGGAAHEIDVTHGESITKIHVHGTLESYLTNSAMYHG